jgi:hypothetical protein
MELTWEERAGINLESNRMTARRGRRVARGSRSLTSAERGDVSVGDFISDGVLQCSNGSARSAMLPPDLCQARHSQSSQSRSQSGQSRQGRFCNGYAQFLPGRSGKSRGTRSQLTYAWIHSLPSPYLSLNTPFRRRIAGCGQRFGCVAAIPRPTPRLTPTRCR